MTNRERLTELRYQMEKNSFILSIFEARIAVVLHAEEMGYPDTETAQILRISPQYVAMIRALKDKYRETEAPNGLKASSIEEIAQIIFDRVYVEDHKYARHFSRFDTELLDRWFELKQQQEALFDSIIDRQQAQAVFRDSYFQKFGTRLSIREIQEKPAQKQQEKATETEPDDEDDTKEMIRALNERVAQDEIICRMYKDGAIPEEVALKYTGGDLEHESFLKLVSIYTDDEKTETEVDVDSWCETQKKEHQMEIIARLVAGGAITPEVAFEYMNKDNDFRDFDEFLRIIDVWTEKEEKKNDDSDD